MTRAYLDVLPILHEHNVELICDDDLDRRQEIGVPGFSSDSRSPPAQRTQYNSPFLLDADPQSERTRQDEIAPVKFRIGFDGFSGDFQSDPKLVVNVALECRHMISGPLCLCPRFREFVDSSFWQPEIAFEACSVLDLASQRYVGEEIEPDKGTIAEWEKDEDFGASETLITDFGEGGIRCVREAFVVFQDTLPGSLDNGQPRHS
jgi:hypothetical protein